MVNVNVKDEEQANTSQTEGDRDSPLLDMSDSVVKKFIKAKVFHSITVSIQAHLFCGVWVMSEMQNGLSKAGTVFWVDTESCSGLVDYRPLVAPESGNNGFTCSHIIEQFILEINVSEGSLKQAHKTNVGSGQ